ncbi:DMT family transporter [Ancylobacter pratisalsi]|uniref:DMT family transporter n=1 Tax=Ancylobacter pratisalsi TaxID=1745854 RepID=A0A6P1YN41_9HYPH|nr:DMT family transporter [Ancylobacter pratisalsi]QIB33643.1 DMT family transporter [Ancylobacter pratisalsi]
MSSSVVEAARGRGETAFLFGQMLLCSFLWAPAFLLLQRIGVDLSPLALTALRDLLGGGVMALWFLVIGQRILPAGREWADWAVLGVLQVIVPNTLTVYALGKITTSLASLIQSSTPLLVALIAPFLFASERLTGARIVGMALGIGGLVLLLGGIDLLRSSDGSVPGALAMAGVPVSYALGNIYVRLVPNAPPARLAYGQLVFSGLPCLAVVLAFSGPSAFAAAGDHLVDLAVLSLMATAVPLIMFMRILRLAGPTVGTMVGYLVPVWTILIGAGLFGETLQMHEVIGGALLLAGIVIASASCPGRA